MIDNNVNMSIPDRIAERINEDPKEMSRFLEANPYTAGGHDYFTFDGIITQSVFLENLYYEDAFVKNKKEKLLKSLQDGGGKNTIFILGYLGCGKTTFINSLLRFYCDRNNFDISYVQEIIFDEYGVTSEKDPIKSIFTKSLLKIIKKYDTSFENFTLFYCKNNEFIRELRDCTVISDFLKYIRSFLECGKKIKIGEDYDDCLSWLKEHCSSKDLFYLIVLFSLSNHFNEKESDIPIVIFMDNLDNINEHEHLEMFSRIIDDFTIDISRIFHKLDIYKDSDKKYRYTNKIKLVIAMRETTKAALPPPHLLRIFGTLYTSHDITEWYDKDRIVNKRLNFLAKSPKLTSHTQKISSIIRKIMPDSYTKNSIIPLFNYDYKRAITAITEAICKYPRYLDEYSDIMELSRYSHNNRYRHGARGILLRFLIDEFNTNTSDNKKESCFKKIGVLDLQNRKSYSISVARMILSYLSNYTETGVDDANNAHSLRMLVTELNGIFTEDKIMQSIRNMYELKDSTWTHLISYRQLVYRDESSGERSIDEGRTTLHYSCAGQIFLETITPHFEFFSARIKENFLPLFCSENRTKDDKGQYKFVTIIKRVCEEVGRCCESLRTHNENVCIKKGYLNPYSSDIKPYLESPYVAQYNKKRVNNQTIKQFHEERIINSHIGYIDTFRIYVLDLKNISNFEKTKINEMLHGLLTKYVCLLDTVIKTSPLHLHYKKQLDAIKSDFTRFNIEVNTKPNTPDED